VTDGERGFPWTEREIEEVVAAYFALLSAELRGERPSKVAIVRQLQTVLPARSSGSIERKMQNVSAILDERAFAWIDGYKPLSHYQSALEFEVDRRPSDERRIRENLAEYQVNALAAPMQAPLAIEDVLVERPSIRPRGVRRAIGLTTGPMGAVQDFKNRRLGRAGEEWVFEAERISLARAGRTDLADQVVWTADVLGDGFGYDIDSFLVDGSPHRIEVKTTNFGPRTPFYITRWEVEVSRREAEAYSLYRVFDFRTDPRLYRLTGPMDVAARLEPTVFVGVPR
jgi:hypothetical protein